MTLNDLVNVTRISRAGTGTGGQTRSYAAHLTGERVRVRPASTGEVEAGRRLDGRVTHIVYARPGADVKRSDRLTGTLIPTLDVLDVVSPSKRSFQVLRCEEVQTGG